VRRVSKVTRPAAAGKLVASRVAGGAVLEGLEGSGASLPSMPAVESYPCGGFDSFEVSCIGPTEMQDLERQQLVMWGEDRQRQVEKLEGEVEKLAREKVDSEKRLAELEQRCAESQAEVDQRCVESQAEVERLTARCTELESQHANSTQENGDLRKQLAAYAVEITVLREDRENSQQALRDAHAQVQRLSEERSDLVRSVQGLELDQSHRSEQFNSAVEPMSVTGGFLGGRFGPNTGTGGFSSGRSEPMSASVSPPGFEYDSLANPSARMDEARRCAEDKDQRIEALIDVIQPLRDQLKTMQEAFIKQTKEFGQFVQRVRQKQFQAVKDINALNISLAGHWQCTQDMPQMVEELSQAQTGVEHGQIQHAGAMRDAHQKLHDQVAEEQRKASHAAEQALRAKEHAKGLEVNEARRKETRLSRNDAILHGRLSKNVRAMAKALQGIEMRKVHQGTGKVNTDARKVAVCDETMRVKWCKPPYKFGKGDSYVEIDKIIGISYGCGTRAHILTNENPCICFGLNTVDRSYDFISRDQDEAECFVLSISRLCNIMAGFTIPGSIPTHPLFVRARAWAKVQQKCRKDHKTLLAVVDSAVRSATDSMPKRAMQAAPRNRDHAESGHESNNSSLGPPPPGGGVGWLGR
jgi:hypothetical protein